MRQLTFRHTGNIGDVWASIPTLREYFRKTGNKAILYLVNGVKAEYYEGAVHPTKNSEGENVMLNEKIIEMMKPLLLAQDFIEDVRIWDNEPIDIPLDAIRDTKCRDASIVY